MVKKAISEVLVGDRIQYVNSQIAEPCLSIELYTPLEAEVILIEKQWIKDGMFHYRFKTSSGYSKWFNQDARFTVTPRSPKYFKDQTLGVSVWHKGCTEKTDRGISLE